MESLGYNTKCLLIDVDYKPGKRSTLGRIPKDLLNCHTKGNENVIVSFRQ